MPIQTVFNAVEAAKNQPAICVTMPSQGSTAETRTGNHIIDDRMQVQIHLRRPNLWDTSWPLDTTHPHHARVICVRWLATNNAYTPVYDEILDNSWGDLMTAGLVSQLVKRRNFVVLYDKVFDVNWKNIVMNSTHASANEVWLNETFIMPLNRSHYFDGDASITGLGNYYWFVLTNYNIADAIGPEATIKVRFWFRDP